MLSSRFRLLAGTTLAATIGLALLSHDGWGRKVLPSHMAPHGFAGFEGPAIGGRTAPAGDAPAHLAGGTIAAVGNEFLVIDADSGELVLADAEGKAVTRLSIGREASQLVYDAAARRAYVADRSGDRIVKVDVSPAGLRQVGAFATATEPFGLALSPDAKTLLVTAVADRTLIALDIASGKERWRHALGREPRGVAISPDGRRAAVAYLATGTVELVDIGDGRGTHVALEPTGNPATRRFVSAKSRVVPSSGGGRGFARNAFAVRFIGHGLTVTAHSMSTPVQENAMRENTGSYGGGFSPPITHRLAFLAGSEAQVGASINVHQPNAMAWDPKADTLYVAGYGSDNVLIVENASQANAKLTGGFTMGMKRPCGPQGLAVTADGKVGVWCSLSRTVATMTRTRGKPVPAFASLDESITKTRFTAQEHRGLELFRAANDGRMSSRGALACASCHPEARADGLSWRIEKRELQTPLLSGKVAGTHPYKWDGGDKDLPTSLTSTMRRLGGSGLSATDNKALMAYLEALPAPRTPKGNKAQVARGKAMFEGELGCSSCHGGTKRTDNERHTLASSLPEVDTPALVGLAYSAPYYHDGSAATLEALLADNALVHGMAETANLTDAQIADIVAYLETL